MKDHSDEFTADAVALYESAPEAATYKTIAADLDISRATLREWVPTGSRILEVESRGTGGRLGARWRSSRGVRDHPWKSVRPVGWGRWLPAGSSANSIAAVMRFTTGSRWTQKVWHTAGAVSKPCCPTRPGSIAPIAGRVVLLSHTLTSTAPL